MLSIEEVSAQAKLACLESGHHMPMMIICSEKGDGIIGFGNMPDTTEQKTKMFFMAGKEVAKKQPGSIVKSIFFITEAWMSKCQKGEIPDVRPSQDPKRKEVLIINQLQMIPEKKSDGVMMEMIRDASNKLTGLGDAELAEGTESPLLKAFYVGFYMGDKIPEEELGSKVEIEDFKPKS